MYAREFSSNQRFIMLHLCTFCSIAAVVLTTKYLFKTERSSLPHFGRDLNGSVDITPEPY
jgi:hypothetical protein